MPGHTETLVGIATDPEITVTSVGVYSMLGARPEGTVADYRRQLVEGLYHAMLNRRLDELRRRRSRRSAGPRPRPAAFCAAATCTCSRPASARASCSSGWRRFWPRSSASTGTGSPPASSIAPSRELLRAYQSAYAERDKTPSPAFAGELVRHYLIGEPAPGIALELELVERILPSLELSELNRLAAEWISEENRVVLVTAPDSEAAELPGEAELLAAFAAADELDPEP